MTKQFFIPLKKIPTVTAQQKKIDTRKDKPIVYEPENLAKARALFEAHLGKHVPDEPITEGVRLFVKWLFPITGKHTSGEYKLTKPDTDNLQKLFKDCMTKVGFWKDDCIVCAEVIEKFYNDVTGIWVYIETI